jgi:glycosyltransferase involved in cell wall biosynthesis
MLHLTIYENHDVSVVILTRNSALTIASCLKSVIREHPREIIAVDGGSQDGTLSILKDHGVSIVPVPSRSLGQSRKLGVEASTGNYVMFVDSDVELPSGSIMRMRAELERLGWVGIHAKIISKENLSYWQRAEDLYFSLYFNHIGPKSHIGTIAAVFRRRVLLEIPFDPNFIESAEDIDLCWRLRRHGFLVGVGREVAYHYHRRDFLSFVRQRFRNGKGQARLVIKYGSKRRLTHPFEGTLVLSIRSILDGHTSLLPYWLVSGCAEFAGIVASFKGLKRTTCLQSLVVANGVVQ